jgi:sec-independent protein translocase protein TatC
MTFTDHLEELRKTVIRVVLILIVSFMLSYNFGDMISELLLKPLRDSLAGDLGGKIVFQGILDKVLSQFQVAFWSSILISSPLWFFEVWRFVKPGLYDFEIKTVKPFLFVGFLLFILGVCFGYFVVFPLTFETLMKFGVGDVDAYISLKEYLVLASKVLVFLGLMFQLPNVLLILGFMGLVTKQSLRNMRRYVYVGFAVISAMMTPPDPLTMLGLWFPLVCLFELGILAVALVVHPYLARQHGAEE